MPEFGTTFYVTLVLLLALLVFMWIWHLKRPDRSRAETILVVLVSLGSLSPVFFLAYLLLTRR